MPRHNNRVSKEIRKRTANERQELRNGRLVDEQIAVLLSRGANPECKEIRRLSDAK